MRTIRRVTITGLIALSLSLLSQVAQADTQRATSENGDIFVTSSSGAHVTSNHDKDNNFNTMTQADKGGLFYSVFNGADFAQTVHISVVLDGPAGFTDRVLVDEAFDLGPACALDGSICTDSQQGSFDFQVRKQDWPAGTYSLIVTGSGSETATVASTFTVSY